MRCRAAVLIGRGALRAAVLAGVEIGRLRGAGGGGVQVIGGGGLLGEGMRQRIAVGISIGALCAALGAGIVISRFCGAGSGGFQIIVADDLLGKAVRMRGRGHGHLRVSRRGNDILRIIFAVVAVRPQIIRSGRVKRYYIADVRLRIVVTVQLRAVTERIIVFDFDLGGAADGKTSPCSADHGRKGLARGHGIGMGDLLVFVKEIMIARGGIHPEGPAGIHLEIHKIAVLKTDMVAGGAPAFSVQRILAVHIIREVLVMSPETVLDIGGAGASGHVAGPAA